VVEIIGNPLHNQLTKFMEDPDLAGRSSFIEEFHQDFSRLVQIYLGKNRVFVFVDDLDRCDVPKAADHASPEFAYLKFGTRFLYTRP
jgi:hypothetical protein